MLIIVYNEFQTLQNKIKYPACILIKGFKTFSVFCVKVFEIQITNILEDKCQNILKLSKCNWTREGKKYEENK